MRDLPSNFAAILTVIATVMTSAAQARADESAGRRDGTILFLGVTAEPAQSPQLTGQVAKHLRLGGYTLAELRPQDTAARHCTASDCLARLAQDYAVDRILTAQVSPDSSDRDAVSTITVGLYDTNRGTMQRSDVCLECTVAGIGDRIGSLSDSILVARPVVDKPLAGALSPSAPTHDPPAAVRSRWTPGRIAGVTILGALTAVSIGTGVGLYALDGQPGSGPCTPPDSPLPVDPTLCRYHTRELAIAGFTVGAVLGVGTILVALLPFRSASKKPQKALHQ